MPEKPNTDTQDTPLAPVVEGQPKPPAGADTGDDAAILAKRYADAQAKISQMGEENAALRKRQDELQAQQLAKLTELAERNAAPAPPDPQQEDARLDALADDLGMDKRQLLYMGEVAARAEQKALQAQEAAAESLRAELQAIGAKFSDFAETSRPEYQQHRETVEKLVQTGKFTRTQAIEAAVLLTPQAESGDSPPGTVSSGARVGVDTGEQMVVTPEQRAKFLTLVPDATEQEMQIAFAGGEA